MPLACSSCFSVYLLLLLLLLQLLLGFHLLRLLAPFGRSNGIQTAIELGYIQCTRFVEALHEAAASIARALSLCSTARMCSSSTCSSTRLCILASLVLQLSHLAAHGGGIETSLLALGLLQLLRITRSQREESSQAICQHIFNWSLTAPCRSIDWWAVPP